MDNKEKVTFNTLILYGRLLFTTLISLYTSRVVLTVVGVEDFGIYSIVGSIVGMLGFLNAALSLSTQRFLSYNLGKKDLQSQSEIFSCSLFLHIALGLIISVGLLLAIPYVFGGKMNIPEERISTAEIIYVFVVISSFLSIISVPFSATFIAHENMLIDSVIYVISDVIRLVGIISLYAVHFDKLIFYGLVILTCHTVEFILRGCYCVRKYPESKFSFRSVHKSTIQSLFSFSFWNAFGGFALVLRNQGTAVVINMFNTVVANAAYGVATQISGALRNFSESLKKALNPQIMRNEGEGNHDNMIRLALYQSKYTFLLIFFITLPIIIDIEYILQLWLKNVPEQTSTYCRLVLIVLLLQQVTNGLQSAINATGRIKQYQIVISFIILFSIVFTYIFLSLGLPSYYSIVSMLIIEIICLFVRPWFAAKYAGVSIPSFVKKTVIPIAVITLISATISNILFSNINVRNDLVKLLLLMLVSSSCISLSTYLLMSKEEKTIFGNLLSKIINHGKVTKEKKQLER